MNYQQANELLTGRCKQQRCHYYASKLVRDGEDILLTHYGAMIVRMRPDGSVTLYGGHGYASSLWRMRRCITSPGGHPEIFSEAGHVCVSIYDHENTRRNYIFQDGITISADRVVTGYAPGSHDELVKEHRRAIALRNKRIRIPRSSNGKWCEGDILRTHGPYLKRCPEYQHNTYRISALYRNENTGREWGMVRCRETPTRLCGLRRMWWYNDLSQYFKKDEFLTSAAHIAKEESHATPA